MEKWCAWTALTSAYLECWKKSFSYTFNCENSTSEFCCPDFSKNCKSFPYFLRLRNFSHIFKFLTTQVMWQQWFSAFKIHHFKQFSSLEHLSKQRKDNHFFIVFNFLVQSMMTVHFILPLAKLLNSCILNIDTTQTRQWWYILLNWFLIVMPCNAMY